MENGVVKSSLLYILKMKTQLQRISFSWFLILPIQTLFIIFSSIQYNIKKSGNKNPVQEVLINIWEKISQKNTLISIYILGFACSFIILATFIIFVFLKKPLNQFDRKAIYLDKLVTFSSFIVIIFEFFLFPIVWHFKHILFNSFSRSQSIELFMLPFVLISIIFVGLINYRIRIMNAFFPILFFVTDFKGPFQYGTSIVGLCICAYAIKQGQIHKFLQIKNRSLTKMIHLLLFCFFMWKFINSFKFSLEKQQNEYVALMYLSILMFLGLIIGFLTFVSKVNKKFPQVIQLCECLQNLQKNPKDNESKMIALKISSQYFKTLTNSQITKIDQQQYQQIEYLCTGKNNDWRLEDWRKLINIMINQQYEKEKSLKLGIDLIKCRLMIKDQRLFDTIVFMKNLIITYKEQNWSSQYELFKIAFHIEDLYFKKYKCNSNSIIHILRQVDRLSNKFYKLCGQQIQYMYQFWSAVANYKINLDKQDDFDPKDQSDQTSNNFNKQFLCSSQVQIEMESFIISIHEGIEKLQRVLSKIQELSIASKEQRVLNYIKFLTTYTHEQNGSISDSLDFQKVNDEIRISGSDLKEDYSQYLEIVDLKITRISLKLATELNYKKMEVMEEKIDFLIPKSYHNDIEQTIMGYNQPVYKVPHLVPLICSDNSIILKSFTSFLELDCDFGYRLLFHVQNNEINRDPLIIYNTMSNTIEYYNRQFIKTFQIDKNKMDAKIRNKYLNPDEIFLDIQLSDKAVQNKLQDSRFQAQYNCRMYTSKIGVRKGFPKMENVRLSLVQKQKGNMILKVMRGHRLKSMMNQIEESSHRQQRSQSSFSFFSIFQYDIGSNLGKKEKKRPHLNKNQDEDHQIFCKIENPYDSKISNKKAQLSKSTKITLKFYAVLAIFLAMILLITQGFSFLTTNIQIDDLFQSKIQYELKQIDMYIELMEAYQNYYEYTLTKIHSTQLSNIFGSYQKLLQKFSSSLEQKITSFQKQYLQNLLDHEKYKSKISYTLKFQHYTIQTDTSRTNLFDIAQNLLRYQNDQKSLKFVIENYKEFGSLINQVTQKHDQKPFWPEQLYFMYYVTSGTIFFVSMCSFLISLILSYKIANVRAEVEYIFRLMQLKNLQPTFKGLNLLRQKINQIRQEGIKEQKKLDRLMKFCLYEYDEQSEQRKQEKLQQVGAIRSHSQQLPYIINTSNASSVVSALSPVQTPRKTYNTSPPYLSPLNSPTLTERGDNLLHKSYIQQDESFSKKEFKSSGESNQKKSKEKDVESQQLQRKPIKIRNLGFFGYSSVIGIVILTFFLQIQHMNEKVYVEKLVTDFKLENKQITENIIHQILETQNYVMNYHFRINNLNNSQISEYYSKFNLFIEKLTMNNFKLPSKYFATLNEIYFKMMTSNLCDNFEKKKIKSFGEAVCSKIFNGIFQFGVTKTIEELNLKLLSITRSNSWFSLSPHGNFSNFQQILFAEQMLLKVIRQTQIELKEYEKDYTEIMREKKIFIFVLGCVLSIGRLVFSIFIKKYIYKASQIGIGYFLIIPKQVLLQNEIVDHLRKNEILDRISNI